MLFLYITYNKYRPSNKKASMQNPQIERETRLEQVHFPLLPSLKLLPRTISPRDFVIRQQSNMVNWQLLIQLESPPKPTISHLKLFFTKTSFILLVEGSEPHRSAIFFSQGFCRKTSSTELKTLRSMVPSISWRRASGQPVWRSFEAEAKGGDASEFWQAPKKNGVRSRRVKWWY